MPIQPYILGSGNAAAAIRQAWALLAQKNPGLQIRPVVQLRRAEPIESIALVETDFSVLCLANPPALHAAAILAGVAAGFSLIVTEKPAAISLDQVRSLEVLRTPVAVCHVYRQLWGIQELRQKVASGQLGDVFAIEGRYWQSSAAQKALSQTKVGTWKNDPALSGPADTLLDIAVHWVDAALFILGPAIGPTAAEVRLSYANSEAPHRDTHVQLQMRWTGGPSLFASISKNVHGASNHFEMNVLGTKGSATWKFLEPDQLVIGEGAETRIIPRPKGTIGSINPPFHGLGWVEGYVGILENAISSATANEQASYPSLQEHLVGLGLLLRALGESSFRV